MKKVQILKFISLNRELALTLILVTISVGLFFGIYTLNSYNSLDPYITIPTERFEDTEEQSSYFLKRFWVASMYDPILALPGTATEELDASIANLKKNQNLYLAFYTKEEQELISKYLHPFDFLESLPQLESTRRDFLLSPTYTKAKIYSDMLMNTLQLGSIYSKDLSGVITQTSPHDFTVEFPAGTTSKIYMANVLEQMRQQFEFQIKKAELRMSCLENNDTSKLCDITLPALVATPPSKNTYTINEDRALQYKQSLMPAFNHTGIASTIVKPISSKLPLVHVGEEACTPYDYGIYMTSWLTSRNIKNLSAFTTPVNDILFRVTHEGVTEFSAALSATGINYEFQPMNPYMCVDNGLVSGEILSALYIQDRLIKQPIFNILLTHERNAAIKKLALLEQTITSQKNILYVSSIEDYIKNAQELLYARRVPKDMSDEDKQRILELITVWRSKSALWEYALNRIDDISVINANILETTHIPMTAIFITRGYFSTLLLTSNETLFSAPISFLEDRNNYFINKTDFVTYSDTVNKYVPLENLADFIEEQTKIYLRVYNRQY